MVQTLAHECANNDPTCSDNLMEPLSPTLKQTSLIISSVAFNARGDHFVIGTTHGFQIYQVDPFELVNSTEIEGGVKTVQLLN